MSVFKKYVPAVMTFLESGYNPDMEPAILKRCLYILLELSEAGQKLETENQTLQERVQKLEQQRNWLVNELCIGTQCDFPSQVECKYRTERGYFCPERNEKFKCWIAHAEQAAKETKE